MPPLGPPGAIGGIYRWPNSVSVAAVPDAYNVLYLFVAHTPEAGGLGSAPYGTFRWSYAVPDATQMAAKRANGTRLILSIGGAGSHIDMTDRTVSTRVVDSIDFINEQWGGTRANPVFDGVDLNTFEAGALRNTTEYIWICSELKNRFGSGFMMTVPPAPWNGIDRDMCRAMLDAGVLDYAAPQWYDGDLAPQSVILGTGQNGYDYWVSYVGRGDASKIVAGFGLSYNNAQTAAYSSWQNIQNSYQTLLGRHPTMRGMFLWDVGAENALGAPVAQNVLPLKPPDFGGGSGGGGDPVDLPTVPTSVSATEITDTSLRLNWSPPADDGGGAVTGYAISIAAAGWNGGNPWSTTVGASTSSYVFTNLLAGTQQTATVAAINAAGTGPAATITPTTTGGGGDPDPDPDPPPQPSDPLTYIGSAFNRGYGASLLVPGVNGTSAGHRAIAFVTQNDSGSVEPEVKFSAPAGWVEIDTVNDGLTYRTGVYQKLLTAPLEAETWGAPNSHWFAVGIVVYAGAAEIPSFAHNALAWGTEVLTPEVASFAGDIVLRYGHGTAGGPGAIDGTFQHRLNQLTGDAGIAHFSIFVGEWASHTYSNTGGSSSLRGITLVLAPSGVSAEAPSGLTVEPITGGLRASWSSTLSEFTLQRERWDGVGTPP